MILLSTLGWCCGCSTALVVDCSWLPATSRPGSQDSRQVGDYIALGGGIREQRKLQELKGDEGSDFVDTTHG
ncbi:hypothetical protein PF005_g2784 [Phytophthora fragariae]|uniref:Secreted protein n=2 Tax=Phytophthora TaxID=4783 RepID=A0A6A3TJ48_9STRA|nr:hypothetical protein PF003_g11869 [Phytophthora fragariae]KAE9042265.1 hypothetical protein PR002_g4003 [Phytophthora rubi]KAE8947279.1 hypothetical protein PF009_g3109 [Phytophthora fragariae]KAE9027566.1 hypothetical protein PF011_g1998 [Phytophthora fragariae]KAE9050399.1 hypothetical protein PR001_g2408 [Phytophthora rubi]